jgi:hypothetical protein
MVSSGSAGIATAVVAPAGGMAVDANGSTLIFFNKLHQNKLHSVFCQ